MLARAHVRSPGTVTLHAHPLAPTATTTHVNMDNLMNMGKVRILERQTALYLKHSADDCA